MSSKTAFLVCMEAILLGGRTVRALDIIFAEDEKEAYFTAANYFISGGDNVAVEFGGKVTFPGTVASISIEVIAAIDLNNRFNSKWKKWAERSQDMQDLLERSYVGTSSDNE